MATDTQKKSKGNKGRGGRKRRGRRQRDNDGFSDKALEIRRVSRVVKGGKRFSFRATVVVGDRKGKVGIGIGKGLDVVSAIQKAKKEAKKNLVTVPITDDGTIIYDVEGTYSSAHVYIKPAPEGHGLVAGGSVRAVLSHAGIANASAKILSRTTNKLTNAMAALEALKKLKQAA